MEETETKLPDEETESIWEDEEKERQRWEKMLADREARMKTEEEERTTKRQKQRGWREKMGPSQSVQRSNREGGAKLEKIQGKGRPRKRKRNKET